MAFDGLGEGRVLKKHPAANLKEMGEDVLQISIGRDAYFLYFLII